MTSDEKSAPTDRIFVKDNTAVTRKILDDTIIVPIRTGAADLDAVYVLNETGSWIWTHLDGHKSMDQLIEGMIARFDVSGKQAREDVDSFLGSLIEEGLVQLTESPK